jgi:hypothetical protein
MSVPVCIITTINPPTPAVRAWCGVFPGDVMVIGDLKTPKNWYHQKAMFFSAQAQRRMEGAYPKLVPDNHYARKNIGYLLAMEAQASVIYDTDDDNAPTKAWKMRTIDCRAKIATDEGWCNVYRYFHASNIWPRGFSLKHLEGSLPQLSTNQPMRSPIQQGLAAGNPDVDAIWRLTMPRNIAFKKELSVVLAQGVWCPFNSQSTWWWPEAYPLLYLPAYASFRMTDIWRSFVAQRCLWTLDKAIVFHSPAEVFQDRNPHDLIRDFEEEVPGYLNNHRIAEVLNAIALKRGQEALCDNLVTCYAALIKARILDKAEMKLVQAWVKDVRELGY